MSGRLRTAREQAALLGVSTGALLRWTRAGRVPAVKLPSGAVRYVPEHIDAWLAECATGTAERGVSATRTDRALPEPTTLSETSPCQLPRPLTVAEYEEEDHAR